ncbi:hypothetical protein TRICI_006809 [Trichomonascus ciferrii]|uniref:Phospholipid-transporting ATPase n=1 Tax=Trichomonascus ciferrii TaxID=44093 RepID=A0A642UDA7_9ASCO|nr:hypothetical protein TRICI_006809 [Trichomonascus ciferrii]
MTGYVTEKEQEDESNRGVIYPEDHHHVGGDDDETPFPDLNRDHGERVAFQEVSKESAGSGSSGDTTLANQRQKRTKRLRFGTIRKKSGHSKHRLRKIGHHVPVLSNFVDKSPPDDEKSSKPERHLYFNQKLPPEDLDPETGMPKAEYPRNKIRTTIYTPLTFVPLNLYYQFHNIANIYFLFIVILSAFKIFGVPDAGLAAVPIIVIVVITAIKDAIEDYRRMALDSELNNTITHHLVNLNNPNVVEDNVSTWRKFKKANTRFWGGIAKAIMKFIMTKIFKQEVEEKQKAEDVDLHTIATNTTAVSHNSSHYEDNANLQPLSESVTNQSRPLQQVPTHYSAVDPNTVTNDSSTNVSSLEAGGPSPFAKDDSVIDPFVEPPRDAKFKRCFWKQVNCGDIIKVYCDEEFPADMVVLSTSDQDGACYIETRNLDGETNLKVRQALRATSGINHSSDCEKAQFQIEAEAPHTGLYTFNGVIKWKQRVDNRDANSEMADRSEPISINNLLLRGCTLRNTKWVIGYAVYTGPETRVMLNSGSKPAKRSRIMRELNINVILNFVFLLVLALAAGIVNGVYWDKTASSAYFFEDEIGSTSAVTGIITFWAIVILLQNLIPISLYISIEIIKTVQAFFIWSDTYMYYDVVDYACTPKSWSISDDLGQVEYIFSDKTGTLTQNVMEFRKCTINGVPYGKAFTEAQLGMLKREGNDTDAIAAKARKDVADDLEVMIQKLKQHYDNAQMDEEHLNFVSSRLVDDIYGKGGKEQQEATNHFLLSLALCHSVLPEANEEGRMVYKAQSPDEEALVDTARDLGYSLLDRTRNGVVIDVLGQRVEFEVLCTLEFNSSRKRMSVIVRMPETGKILLICKGADSIVYSRLTDEGQDAIKQKTAEDLEEFANEGLRTLCIAQRELSEEYYRDWAVRNQRASEALVNREGEMEKVADEIERELTLLGGTAIEDRLQDGVPAAISLLGQAGIKIWVLTGDKVETAINIGYSCNLLQNDMDLLVLQLEENTAEEADRLLTDYLHRYFGMTGSDEELAEAKKIHAPPESKFAVVIDGDALAVILKHDLKQKFVLLCKQCRSVLCCRVSPSQKAAVVEVVKTKLDVMTLSIGDGANDVAMIQKADVGVGIAGVEGRQAVMSSDYAFGQFRFLTRLLLVHGRWAYRRLAEMTANLFYKNVVFTLTLFWYGVHNNFDSSYLFDYTYITLFNLAFTSLPVIFMGFLDQDVSDKVSIAVPELYHRGIFRKEWTQLKFW